MNPPVWERKSSLNRGILLFYRSGKQVSPAGKVLLLHRRRARWGSVPQRGNAFIFLLVQENEAKEARQGGARRAAPPLETTPVFSNTHRHMPGNVFAVWLQRNCFAA